MRRSLFALLLLASPASAAPLFGPAESTLWMRVPVLPDVVRSGAARAGSSGGGASASGNNAWTGTNSFIDGSFSILGSSDATKILKFEVDGFTTGQTRTVTFPDANITVAALGTTNAFTGANSFVDGSLSIVGSSDATKIAVFEVDGFTTANTRVFTIPGTTGNDTFVMLGGTQTITGGKTFSATNTTWTDSTNIALGTSTDAVLSYRTANTPDTLSVGVSSDSNTMIIREQGDSGNDSNNGPCLTAACTHPTVVIMSATGATVADYSSHNYAGIAGKTVKTLADGVATDTIDVSVAAEAGTAGMYLVSVYATDGSTPQIRMVRVMFAATNDGGTTTCTLGTPEEIDHTPTGTLTATITCVDGTNALTLQVNAASSLTETTLEARSQVILFGPGQILPQ